MAEGYSKYFSGSVYRSSDADGDVEVEDDEEAASDLSTSTANLSLDPSCIICRERDNTKTIANWKCKDCSKRMCDSCNTMHGLLLKDHSVTKLATETCALCKQKDNTVTEANWHCASCDHFMCDGCKIWHGMFLKDHVVTLATAKKEIKPGHRTSPIQPHPTVPPTIQKHAPAKENKQQKAQQEISRCEQSPQKRTFQLITTKSVLAPGEKNAEITSSAFLPDGRLLLVDHLNKSLKLFSPDFTFMETKVFDEKPWDVAVYDSSEIAISVNYSIIVRISACKDIEIICHLNVDACGLAYIDKSRLAVSSVHRPSFLVIRSNGDVLLKVSSDLFRTPLYVAVDVKRSRAYVSDNVKRTVTSIDLTSGNVIFEYENKDLPCPYGVTVDKEGCIYVCTLWRVEDNIQGIFPNGEYANAVTTAAPTKTLSFNPNNNDVVAAGLSKELSLYRLL